jgi:glucan phosphorylase
MNKLKRVSSPIYTFFPAEVEGFDLLGELALDMRWSWNHAADEVWMQLDPQLWDLTHNPWVVLQTVSRDRLQQVLDDPVFRGKVDALVETKRHEAEAPAWFQQRHPRDTLTAVAYFSMEFMLSEALPIYSGGLGNVAGDQLKAASDLGVPVVGVGLLYQQGYFRQVIDRLGAQQALFPYNDPGQLPVMPVREPNGEWHDSDPTWDSAEAEALYTLLEREVMPEFYSRDRNGIPVAWVARIRESMARLTTHFSSNRTVRQYTEHYYIPAAVAYRERAADKGEVGAQVVAWQHALERAWANLHFGEATIAKSGDQHIFEVQVYLNGLDPDSVRVELYAEGVNSGDPVLKEMARGLKLVGAENGYVYGAQVQATRPATDYTARVIPHRTGIAVPLEAAHILWQR